MSLIADPTFVIHRMRIKYLRVDERTGERIISFQKYAMTNDYIKTAAPYYPEMDYCYSPPYSSTSGADLVYRERTVATSRKAIKGSRNKSAGGELEPVAEQGGERTAAEPTAKTGEAQKDRQPLLLRRLEHASVGRKHSAPALFITAPSKSLTHDGVQATALSPLSIAENGGPGDTAMEATASDLSNDLDGPAKSTTSFTYQPSLPFSPSLDSPDLAPPPEAAAPEADTNSDNEPEASVQSEASPTLPTLAPAARQMRPRRTVNMNDLQAFRKSNRNLLGTQALNDVTPNDSPQLERTSPTSPEFSAQTPPKASIGDEKPPTKSMLSELIAASNSAATNPFAAFRHVAGKGETNFLKLCVYFPHSSQPLKPIHVVVKRDAIVEDVIGYILYQYLEYKLDPDLTDEQIDVCKWMLKIAEEDGEVEEDLPAVDRTRRINRVSFDQFALCEASEAQAKVNHDLQVRMGRATLAARPTLSPLRGNSSTVAQKSDSGNVKGALSNNVLDRLVNPIADPMKQIKPSSPGHLVPPSAAAIPTPSTKSNLTKSALINPDYKYLRVRLPTDKHSEVSAVTTVPVLSDMFVGDVLELVCRKRKLDPNVYMLVYASTNQVVSENATVESLKLDATQELSLVRREDMMNATGGGHHLMEAGLSAAHMWRSPSKKKSDAVNVGYGASAPSQGGYLLQYKKYVVHRKTSMLVGRRECALAIDGEYIHIMPPEHRGMFDTMRTSSYHISQVQSCKQSKKAPHNFKLIIWKDRDYKTYDFEAESTQDAGEIWLSILESNLLFVVLKPALRHITTGIADLVFSSTMTGGEDLIGDAKAVGGASGSLDRESSLTISNHIRNVAPGLAPGEFISPRDANSDAFASLRDTWTNWRQTLLHGYMRNSVACLGQSKVDAVAVPAKHNDAGEALQPTKGEDNKLSTLRSSRKVPNFSDPSSIALFFLDNHYWASVEHYVQAQKFQHVDDITFAKYTLESKDPLSRMECSRVKKYGRRQSLSLPPNAIESWQQSSLALLKRALTAKFEQNPDLLQTLLATRDAILVKRGRAGPSVVDHPLMFVRQRLWQGMAETTFIMKMLPSDKTESNTPSFGFSPASISSPPTSASLLPNDTPTFTQSNHKDDLQFSQSTDAMDMFQYTNPPSNVLSGFMNLNGLDADVAKPYDGFGPVSVSDLGFGFNTPKQQDMDGGLFARNGLQNNLTDWPYYDMDIFGNTNAQSNGALGTPNAHGLLPSNMVNMIPTPPSQNAVSAATPQPVSVKDAVRYLDEVRKEFADVPGVFEAFLEIMNEFKSQSINTPSVLRRVATLFKGHPDLIKSFMIFLPPGHLLHSSNMVESKNAFNGGAEKISYRNILQIASPDGRIVIDTLSGEVTVIQHDGVSASVA
ncbi:hypothetical protein BZG36_01213 [Bifiguratus adelaidae]|uniref:Uncharacterized protein n=1 Tax=Bifiguratus adelaidae TaxID=1938954 RepID=A0A261Y651_9FUNG|nr:hypothetical protein BZG36_01213 [Bifiguratus adelaidae]